MDVWDYFQDRSRECRKLALSPDDLECAELVGSNGQRGMIFGQIQLSENAFLTIHEVVVVRGTGIHREEYSYYLIMDGFEMWGRDCAPTHNPPEHGHQGKDHRQIPAGRVKFKEVVELAWDTIAQEETLLSP